MLKTFLKDTLYFLRDIFHFFKKEKRAVVLMYHSVGDNGLFFTVKKSEFERQMKYLKDNNFNVVSLKKIAEYLNKKEIPPRTIAITFDDGYEDNYLNAFPILNEYFFTATIFIPTGLVGSVKEMDGNISKVVTWEEIKEMELSGLVDIEPHTVNHKKLHGLDTEEIRKEIVGSKIEIEKRLNKICRFFAYPSGRYNDKVVDVVRNNGFKSAFGVVSGLIKENDNRFELKRNSIDSEVDFYQFRKIAESGKVEFRK